MYYFKDIRHPILWRFDAPEPTLLPVIKGKISSFYEITASRKIIVGKEVVVQKQLKSETSQGYYVL